MEDKFLFRRVFCTRPGILLLSPMGAICHARCHITRICRIHRAMFVKPVFVKAAPYVLSLSPFDKARFSAGVRTSRSVYAGFVILAATPCSAPQIQLLCQLEAAFHRIISSTKGAGQEAAARRQVLFCKFNLQAERRVYSRTGGQRQYCAHHTVSRSHRTVLFCAGWVSKQTLQ